MSALKRRMKRLLAEDEERGIGSIQDAAFFKENPHRNFRMRLATPGEVATLELMALRTPSDDTVLWSVIKQVAPGMRMRVPVFAPPPLGPITEIPEHLAQHMFNGGAS